jgi:hypothetical protein
MDFMGNNPVFVYPNLLPTSAIKPTPKLKNGEEEKVFFAKAEDQIIALGLEFYFGGTNKWKKTAALQVKSPYLSNFSSKKSIKKSPFFKKKIENFEKSVYTIK